MNYISNEALYELFLQHPVVTTDSRQCPEGSIFVALKGDSFDGNRFAVATLEAGCAYAVVDNPDYVTSPRILLVEDGLKCLQDLAALHRRRLARIPLIGITGTNGKTTTKELTAQVLRQKYRVLYTQGNFNNHIGVPLTLLQLRPDHDLAIIEMGANHPGEIRTLVNIAQPDYGLITNVGKAHLAGFGSFEGVMRTKGELYDYLRAHGGKAFVNLANGNLRNMLQGLSAIAYEGASASYPAGADGSGSAGFSSGGSGSSSDGSVAADGSGSAVAEPLVRGQVVDSREYLSLSWQTAGQSQQVQTHLVGSYNLENALAAVAVGTWFGVPQTDIRKALADYVPSNNRSQRQQTAHNQLIIDAYNANPTSMNAALDNFLPMKADGPKAVILGGMRELGSYSEGEHRHLLERLAASDVSLALLIGEEFLDLAGKECPNPTGEGPLNLAGKGVSSQPTAGNASGNGDCPAGCPGGRKTHGPELRFFASAEECLKFLRERPLSGYTILLKGSRSNRLELLVPAL